MLLANAVFFFFFFLRKAISLTLNSNKHSEFETNAKYPDHLALLVNTPTQAESLKHSLNSATGSISLFANANKTEYM